MINTKGLLAIAVCSMIGLGAGSMYIKNKADKEVLLVDPVEAGVVRTIVEPPIVEVVVTDEFVEEVLAIEAATTELIETMVDEEPEEISETTTVETMVVEEPDTTELIETMVVEEPETAITE